MKNQGVEGGEEPGFLGLAAHFSVLPELSAPGTLEVALWKDGFDVRPELQFGLCRLKLPLSLSQFHQRMRIISTPTHCTCL